MKVVSSSSERPNRNTSKVEIFKRIIDQEIASGYEDRAVIGGIDNFIRKWSTELVPMMGEMSGYSVLSYEERKNWVNEVVERFKTKTENSLNLKKQTIAPLDSDLKLPSPISRLKIAGGIRKYIPQLKKLGIYNIGSGQKISLILFLKSIL